MKDKLVIVVIGLYLCFPTGATAADTKRIEAPPLAVQPRIQTPPYQPPHPSVNSITLATVKSGVIACTSRINQITNFLTAGNQGVGANLFTPPATPDQKLVSVSMEIPTTNTSSAYVSASFSPNQVDGCDGMYEAVAFWQVPCNETAAKNFTSFKQTGTLSKNIQVLDGGRLIKVFLLPAGQGCVSIKKEIVQ